MSVDLGSIIKRLFIMHPLNTLSEENRMIAAGQLGGALQEAIRRSGRYDDEPLSEVLKNADAVMVCRPLTPEGCRLVAHDTGDGWYLGVEDSEGNEVAMLDWPQTWPDSMSASKLRECGFEVV